MKIEFKKSDYVNLSSESLKKILYVLDRLKDEAELVVEDEHGIKIITVLISELNMEDKIPFRHINNILEKLQQERIIEKFRILQPFV